MNYDMSDDDSCNLPNDEIHEIRRAMRVANARKRSLSHQIRAKVEKNSSDMAELDSMLKAKSMDLNNTKKLLSQAEFDLKEARFEINTFAERETKLKEERRMVETRSKEIIDDLRNKLEKKHKYQEDRNQISLFECDKLIKTLNMLYKSIYGGSSTSTSNPAPKTSRQLLDKALYDTSTLKEFLQSKSLAPLDDSGMASTGNGSRSDLNDEADPAYALMFAKRLDTIKSTGTNNSDNALLDMCRSLEEENKSLSDTVETLRTQVAEASRDASVNRLIPHYRLAIVRYIGALHCIAL
mmetsp:Transcript_1407/g.2333  ORF Transcript_1407/g.2333 Transcript_1407/m.2333 type:complete len:296 (+) Transcript_1407:60-947(+)